MLKKTFSSLTDVFKNTAELKHQAALARKQGKNDDVEPSYDVYLNSCANVATAFENIGFVYTKSGPRMTKKEGGMKFSISFQTSTKNVPGQYVQMLICANVKSIALKKWREKQSNPYRKDDWVAGGLVHLLDERSTYIEWDLADKCIRPQVIADVVQHIKDVVLPFFSLFEDPMAAIDVLEKSDIPSMDISDAVEFALCFGSKGQAQSILNRYVKEHPDFRTDIEKFLEDFGLNGYPEFAVTQYAGKIAWMCLSYGLEVNFD